MLVPFNDSGAIAAEIRLLLDDPERRRALQRRAYDRGRDMIWPVFAAQCLEVIEATRITPPVVRALNSLGLDGLLRICDDTGIIQHSIHSIPDRAHGYCVDDNARALMLMNRLGAEAEPQRTRLTATFAAFVQSSWNQDADEFRNFMGYGRNWLEDAGSEDSCGRTLWSLGATSLEGQNQSIRSWAFGLFDRTATSALGFASPRATAFAMLGADYLLSTDPLHETASAIVSLGADRLLALFDQVRRHDWPWFETMLAYDNCRLSEAMIRAGMRLGRANVLNCGIESLRWIIDQQVSPSGQFRPIGSDSFGHDFEAPRPFDQQPVEIWAAIDACTAAYDASGATVWLDHAKCAHRWFAGGNDRGVAVGDPITGTCHDGINPRGLNLNEGAESVLAYHLADCAMRALLTKAANTVG